MAGVSGTTASAPAELLGEAFRDEPCQGKGSAGYPQESDPYLSIIISSSGRQGDVQGVR